MDPADEALLAAARAGDKVALGQLLERYQPRVYRFGMKMCRDPEDAQEILQETLLAVARGVHDFRGGSSLSTWLYTIARSFCIKRRRRSKFAPSKERSLDTDLAVEVEQLPDTARSPDDALASRQLEQALDRAVDALEPMSREVLILRDIEGLTAPEVAQILGTTTQAVKSRLHRARLSVRQQLVPLIGAAPELATAPGKCPDVATLFSRYLEGEINAETCRQMERHLEVCPRCKQACDSLRNTLALCRAPNPSDVVPAPVQALVKAAIQSLGNEGR